MTEFWEAPAPAGEALNLVGHQPVSEADARLLSVANTWADQFSRSPADRAQFITNYVARCKQQRFWTITADLDGQLHALCRLEDVFLLFDGRTIAAYKLPAKPRNYMRGIRLPQGKPKEAAAFIRRFALAHRGVVADESQFDSLTSFSQAAYEVAARAMQADVGYRLNDGATRDMRFVRYKRPFYLRCLGAALKTLWGVLHPDVLRSVRSVGCPSIALYNWIAAGDVERRLQAVRAYPVMLPAMVISISRARSDYALKQTDCLLLPARAGELVDSGLPLLPVLATWSERSPSLLKAAQRVSPYQGGSALSLIRANGVRWPMESIFMGVELGNRQPRCKTGWRQWSTYLDTQCSVLRTMINGPRMASFLAGCPLWGAEEWGALLPRVRDLRDLNLRVVHDILQALIDTEPRKWTLRRLLNLSDAWHGERNRLQMELARADEQDSDAEDKPWLGLLQQRSLLHPATGIELVELTLPVELHIEATRMRHCVDGYSAQCYGGDSRIISLRRADRSLATAELVLGQWKVKPTRSVLRCAQLRGPGNARIPGGSQEQAAFDWFMRQIKGGAVPVNLEWPCIPEAYRPTRMRMRAHKMDSAMREWLKAQLYPLSPAASKRLREIERLHGQRRPITGRVLG